MLMFALCHTLTTALITWSLSHSSSRCGALKSFETWVREDYDAEGDGKKDGEEKEIYASGTQCCRSRHRKHRRHRKQRTRSVTVRERGVHQSEAKKKKKLKRQVKPLRKSKCYLGSSTELAGCMLRSKIIQDAVHRLLQLPRCHPANLGVLSRMQGG